MLLPSLEKRVLHLKFEVFPKPGMAFIKIVVEKGGYIKYNVYMRTS